LSSYVSEEVARVIVRQPDAFESALRGERRVVTVLFADIRNFTSLAERAEPGAFIAQLNEYLRPVVDCVLTTGGTLQKFIGDAVLAVWGDTHTTGEKADAVRAVEAALAIEQAIIRLNAGWAGRADRAPLRIGVGLQQGAAMVGNIGHPRRMEFAVLGDTVNLASRLEGANRFFGTTVLVGDTVGALVADQFHLVPVARIVVKGRSQPVEVYTPFGPRAAPAPAWLPAYLTARDALQAGRFAEAAAAFGALPTEDVRFGALFHHQQQLAARFAAAPPPAWDGTIHLEQK
jgi:adenylate cyclase